MTNLYSYYFQVLFIAIIITNHVIEIYLNRRQLRTLQIHQGEVPDAFKSSLSLPDHHKAIQYATAKLKLTQIHLVWEAILLLYWFPLRGAEKLILLIPEWGIHREVLFLVAFSAIQAVLAIPWSVYSTFVLEQRFGFNRTTPKLFIFDRLKGLVLGGLIAVPLLYGIIYLFQNVKMWWLLSFIGLTLFQFLLVWIYPTIIAPLFNKFHPLKEEALKSEIEKLVGHAGFKANGVFIMDASRRTSHGNAYFTGFGQNKRIVFFDTLLKDLAKNEVLAILAHELGHLKLKHIPKSLVTSLIISFFAFWLMGKLANENWFYTGHFIRIISPGVLILLFAQAIPLYSFWFTPVSSWISRKREFEADAYAAQETGPEDLISGLIKLYQQNANPVVVDKVYSTFYHSHPPAFERIKKLKSFKGKTGQGLS